MKKIVKMLEFIVKLCGAVIMMEIAANAYICVSTGFRWTWTWTEFQDMVIGYPLILGAAWGAFHVETVVGFIKKLFNKNKEPNLIVLKGGDIEGR